MKTVRDRTVEDNHLPTAAAGSLFPYEISWRKMPQGSTKVEIIQLFPGHCGTVTMMVVAAGGSWRSGLHISSYVCGMPAAMVPAMPVAALRQYGNQA